MQPLKSLLGGLMSFRFFFLCFGILGIQFLNAASSIGVVSLAIGDSYKALVENAIKNKVQYCQLHGYDFYCPEHSLDSSRSPLWSKIPAILKAMENSEHQWIFWTDADALFTNFAYKLEEFIDENYLFIVSKDVYDINTGHFFIRNCERAKQLLRDMYAREECVSHEWAEQMAFICEYREKPEVRAFTKLIPQRLINSYPPELLLHSDKPDICIHKKGDFIIHFPSLKGEYLKKCIDTYVKKVVNSYDFLTLGNYFKLYGFQKESINFYLGEKVLTRPKRRQMRECLLGKSSIKRIACWGLHRGGVTDIFFRRCRDLDILLSFDAISCPETLVAKEFFSRKYREKFVFCEKDCLEETLVADKPFDLIYIDSHRGDKGCLSDLEKIRFLADSETILWINNYTDSVHEAVSKAVENGLIKILAIHHSQNKNDIRVWCEAQYKMER